MNMNGSTVETAARFCDKVQPAMAQVIAEWMRAVNTTELTFALHENKLTVKSITIFRTTV